MIANTGTLTMYGRERTTRARLLETAEHGTLSIKVD